MNLRSRVEQLEQETPGLITLVLDDGSRLSFPGLTPLEFCLEAKEQFRRGGGRISDAILRAVDSSSNVGKLWQLMRAVWIPEERGIVEPMPLREAAPIKAFKATNSDLCPN